MYSILYPKKRGIPDLNLSSPSPNAIALPLCQYTITGEIIVEMISKE